MCETTASTVGGSVLSGRIGKGLWAQQLWLRLWPLGGPGRAPLLRLLFSLSAVCNRRRLSLLSHDVQLALQVCLQVDGMLMVIRQLLLLMLGTRRSARLFALSPFQSLDRNCARVSKQGVHCLKEEEMKSM